MSYIDTYKSEFRFSVQGRTTHRDFWIYTIGTWLITLAVSLVAGLIYGATGSETLFMVLIIIDCIGLFVLNIAYIFVTIRRLHDMGLFGLVVPSSVSRPPRCLVFRKGRISHFFNRFGHHLCLLE